MRHLWPISASYSTVTSSLLSVDDILHKPESTCLYLIGSYVNFSVEIRENKVRDQMVAEPK